VTRKILLLCSTVAFILMLIGIAYASETIKVLILNETCSKLPAKNEDLEQIGGMEGDLLVMGTKYTGNITVWKGAGGLYVVNEIPLEDYVKDVVAVEVSPNWDKEALKAQAVVTRTYAVYQKMTNGNAIYDIASSVLHQVYKGNNPDPRVSSAVEETKDEVLTFDGKPIAAFYHSTSGGKTENPEEVFGKSYPYLHSVETDCSLSPYATWERSIPAAEIEKALNITGIKQIMIKSFTSTNRVKQLDIVHSSGTTTVNATDLRKALGWSRLPSTNFSIAGDGNPFVLEGKGYGHGVGLCQWSTLRMAREGSTYREILSFFYPGTSIQYYENR
jgi:stage II sporulation protein D (peptidoglycan lytic transglycosylase)